MKFAGSYGFELTPEVMWEKLNDPVFLRAVIPRCKKFEKRGGNIYDVASSFSIGPFPLNLRGVVRLKPVQPPRVYMMKAEASSWLGASDGITWVNLLPHEKGVIFRYRARLAFSSELAKLGAGVLNGTVSSMVDRFFERVAIALETTLFETDEAVLGGFEGEIDDRV